MTASQRRVLEAAFIAALALAASIACDGRGLPGLVYPLAAIGGWFTGETVRRWLRLL